MGIKYNIVLVPFLFDDQKQAKIRPALCLSEPIGKFQHIVVAYISSKILENKEESDVLLDFSLPDFPMTGLHQSSIIKLHRLLTIANDDIRRKLGELPPSIKMEVQQKFRTLFFI